MGRKPLVGKFHSHLSIAPVSDEQLGTAARLVGGKVTVVDLARGARSQRDDMITHHYVTGFRGLRDGDDVLALLKRHTQTLTKAGIDVTRVKLEHEPLHVLSPRPKFAELLPGAYTEVHVKCAVSEACLEKLVAEATAMGWHPSRNPYSKVKDGKLAQFVNRRFYGDVTLLHVVAEASRLAPAILHIADIGEVKYETAVYDSREDLDGWWMRP